MIRKDALEPSPRHLRLLLAHVGRRPGLLHDASLAHVCLEHDVSAARSAAALCGLPSDLVGEVAQFTDLLASPVKSLVVLAERNGFYTVPKRDLGEEEGSDGQAVDDLRELAAARPCRWHVPKRRRFRLPEHLLARTWCQNGGKVTTKVSKNRMKWPPARTRRRPC